MKKFDPVKLRRGVTLTALAASMPILMATSAQATTAKLPLGCTVDVKTPVQIGDDLFSGANQAKGTITLKCPPGVWAIVDQRLYEQAPEGLTQLGRTTHYDTFAFGTENDTLTAKVPNTPGTEKVIQRAKITEYDVFHLDGLQSAWITSGSVLVS